MLKDFALDVYPGKRPPQTLRIAKICRFQLQERQHTTFQVKMRLF